MRCPTVAAARQYAVTSAEQAREIARTHLQPHLRRDRIALGLPEIDDRTHVWRVAVVSTGSRRRAGEIVIDARTGSVAVAASTGVNVIEARLAQAEPPSEPATVGPPATDSPSQQLPNTIALGSSEEILKSFRSESVNLVFTSPPYYNARPQYSESVDYAQYLGGLRSVIGAAHRVLAEGSMFVVNLAPVLVRRTTRGEASRRIAVPFDVHQIMIEEGYEFIDDIIWVKPEGAGWATGRGRRFAADRNPMQYKAVPVTEYVLVYRKQTKKLIDWHIRRRDHETLRQSKVPDGYERTNVWRLSPATSAIHPAVFPIELAERVIRYYSFVDDVVLDPFAGIGTVGAAATRLRRKFVLIDREERYVDEIKRRAVSWLGSRATEVATLNTSPIVADALL